MLSVRTFRWLLPALVLGVVIALAVSPGATPAVEAHALLVRADPPENAQLREPPAQITLYFSEPLEQQYSRVSVVNQDGENVDERFEFLAEDDAAMRVFLLPIEPGFLSVEWATVSKVDGHRIDGSFPLTILNADGSLPAGQPPAASSSTAGDEPDPLRVLDKWVLLLAGSVLIGALAFVAYVTPRGVPAGVPSDGFRRAVGLWSGGAVVVLMLGGLAELALQALDIDTSVSNVLSTQWGERWLYRNLLLLPVAGLVVALAAGLTNRRLIAGLALADVAGYLVLTSSVSHAGAGGGSAWAIAADFVHLLTASMWIGMVIILALVFRWTYANLDSGQRYPVLSSALQRFSVVAAISVALLLFTGTVSAVIEVGRVGDLFDTDYGIALTLKLVLLLPLLAIAGYNAYLLRPDFVEANDTTANLRDRQSLLQDLERQLARRIRYEAAVAVVVLAVVSLLVQLTPTRGRLEPPDQGAGEYVENVDLGDLQVTFRITPNEPGFNTFEVYLAGEVYLEDGSDAVEGLRLEFTDPNGFASESRLILDPSNPPTFYLGEGPFLPEAGVWNIVLNIRRSAGLDLRPVFTVDVEDTAPVATGSRTGGSFDSPVDFNPGSVTLLALSALLSVAVIGGSLPRTGRPEGYLGWLAAEAAYRFAPVNVRPVWALGGLIAFGIALGLIVGNHLDEPLSPDEASRENPIEATQESIARGAMLFSQNCTICHGETGRGDGPAAPSLSLQPANLYDHIPIHPDVFFFGVISKGLGGVMPAFEGQLSEEDRWNILNYLRATFTAQPTNR